jgi:hypothetical protein
MDSSQFDRIAAALSGDSSRRDTLRLLGASLIGAGGLALLGAEEGDARKKRKNRKKKRKNKNKNNCKGRCGGKCPRCGLGTTCSSRDECTTALCSAGVCTKPDNAGDCGTDIDGNMCATREINGVNSCTKVNGTFIAGGTCAQCPKDEVCFIPNDTGVECLKLCGEPN